MASTGGRSSAGRPLIPPYSSFVAFETLVRRAGSEAVPPLVDKALLIDWGIAAGNESGLITTLKSLGIVDEEGRPTELYREIRLSQPRRTAALRRASERAYPGLADSGEPPDDDQIHDYFVEERGLTGQMVDKAMRFYRQLAHALEHPGTSPDVEAGRRAAVSSGPTAPRHRPADASSKGTQSSLADNRFPARWPLREGQLRFGEVGLTVVVQVAAETTEDELTELFRRVRRAWRQSEVDPAEAAD